MGWIHPEYREHILDTAAKRIAWINNRDDLTEEQKRRIIALIERRERVVTHPNWLAACEKAQERIPWASLILHGPVDWYYKERRLLHIEWALEEIEQYL